MNIFSFGGTPIWLCAICLKHKRWARPSRSLSVEHQMVYTEQSEKKGLLYAFLRTHRPHTALPGQFCQSWRKGCMIRKGHMGLGTGGVVAVASYWRALCFLSEASSGATRFFNTISMNSKVISGQLAFLTYMRDLVWKHCLSGKICFNFIQCPYK